MIYLQIHGLLNWIPLENQNKIINWRNLAKIHRLIEQRRAFSNTHLVNVSTNVGILNTSDYSSALIDFQRNIHKIPSMEPHNLTRAMMQSSKSGFHKKNIWDKYISRSLELRDKFSVKNISIIMISSAKSNISYNKFYNLMSERIVIKAQNYINTYKIDPKRFFVDDFRNEFTAFNIYTILSACTMAGYKDENMFKLLYKVSEIKLILFNKYLENNTLLKSDLKSPFIINTSGKEDKFTFEDVAGILYSYSLSDLKIDQMVHKYSELFKKMYNISKDGEKNTILEIGQLTPKAFAITINSLVRLGDKSKQLYKIGMEYILENIHNLSMKDMVMIFNSIVKISTFNLTTPDEFDSLESVANSVLDGLSGLEIDPESLSNLSSTFVTIYTLKLFGSDKTQQLKNKFNKLFTEASYSLLPYSDLDNSVLIQLMSNSSLLGVNDVSIMLLSNPNLRSVGLREPIRQVSQFISSLALIHSTTSSSVLKELINDHVVLAVRQYGKRLTYVLYPHSMKLSKTRARPSGLYNILKLESKGLLDVKADDINKDWEKLTAEISEITPENISILASVLTALGKFKPCKDFIKFVSLSTDYILKFIKFHSHEYDFNPFPMDTVSAIINTLSKYRIRSHELMDYFSKLIKTHLKDPLRLKDCSQINYVALFSIIKSYGKLGLPRNGLFTNKSRNRCTRFDKSNVHYHLFKTISKVLSLSNFDAINLQMVTNCLYSLSLVGFDKFGRRTLVRLLDKFIKSFSNHNTASNKEGLVTSVERSHIFEYIKQFDKANERDFTGLKELYSQVNIITLMLDIMVKNDFFKSRVFNVYLKRMKKLVLKFNNGPNWIKNSSDQMCKLKEPSYNEESYGNRLASNRMSSLHRSVLNMLRDDWDKIQSEVSWNRGTYYIDVVIKNSRRHKFIEIDGPYHYYSQTRELISSSLAKDYIIKNNGHKLIHIPYFEWAKWTSDKERLEYLASKLNLKI